MRRSLTAVLAADVAGYSRMMSEDADRTLATLRRMKKELLLPVIASRRGRIVKSMGDGWIVTFDAVSDAVESGMMIQDRLKIDGDLRLRTGIHIGDIAREDDDVFGEGVNIAARLQDIADPGSLAISDAVYSLLDGTLRPSFDDAGPRSLKNIPRPVRIWVRGGEIAGQAAALSGAGLPELTIRPVTSTDDRADVQDLAAALTGDLAYSLGGYRIFSARVSEAPKAAGYELRSALRASGPRLRLEVQLIAPGGAIIESFKTDGHLDDVFDWQDATGALVAGRITKRLFGAEITASDALPPDKRSAAQWTFMACVQNSLDLPGHLHVFTCLERAIALQPGNGFNYALAVMTTASALGLGYGSRIGRAADQVEVWAQRLHELEPAYSPARVILSWMQIVTGARAASEIRAELEALTRHLPFEVETLNIAGWVYLYLGEPETALAHLQRLTPDALPDFIAASVTSQLGFAHLQLGAFETALPYLLRSHALAPGFMAAPAFLVSAYGHLDRPREAQRFLDLVLQEFPEWSISDDLSNTGFVVTPSMQRYIDGLRKAGVPE